MYYIDLPWSGLPTVDDMIARFEQWGNESDSIERQRRLARCYNSGAQ